MDGNDVHAWMKFNISSLYISLCVHSFSLFRGIFVEFPSPIWNECMIISMPQQTGCHMLSVLFQKKAVWLSISLFLSLSMQCDLRRSLNERFRFKWRVYFLLFYGTNCTWHHIFLFLWRKFSHQNKNTHSIFERTLWWNQSKEKGHFSTSTHQNTASIK